jgi:hypothetical protein
VCSAYFLRDRIEKLEQELLLEKNAHAAAHVVYQKKFEELTKKFSNKLHNYTELGTWCFF